MVAAHEGKHKDLVKFIAGQTCLGIRQVQRIVSGYQLQQKITTLPSFSETERTQPTIYQECLSAPEPEALAKQATEEGWTAHEDCRMKLLRIRRYRRFMVGWASSGKCLVTSVFLSAAGGQAFLKNGRLGFYYNILVNKNIFFEV